MTAVTVILNKNLFDDIYVGSKHSKPESFIIYDQTISDISLARIKEDYALPIRMKNNNAFWLLSPIVKAEQTSKGNIKIWYLELGTNWYLRNTNLLTYDMLKTRLERIDTTDMEQKSIKINANMTIKLATLFYDANNMPSIGVNSNDQTN